MYRIDDPSNIASRPAAAALATEGWFLRGVAGGAQGTIVTAEYLNMLQQELENIRALNPTDPGSDKTDDAQLADAITARIKVPLYSKGLILASESGTLKLTMAAGRAWDSGDAIPFAQASSLKKDLNATFAVGDDAGGRAATIGSVSNDTNYFVHSLHKPDGTTEMGFDDSPVAANLLAGGTVATLAGFTTYRHEGYAMINGSGDMRLFYISPHKPDYIEFARPDAVFNNNSPIDCDNADPFTFNASPMVPINTRMLYMFEMSYVDSDVGDDILSVAFHPKGPFPFPTAPTVRYLLMNTNNNNSDDTLYPGEVDVDSAGDFYGSYFTTGANPFLEVNTHMKALGFYFQRGL